MDVTAVRMLVGAAPAAGPKTVNAAVDATVDAPAARMLAGAARAAGPATVDATATARAREPATADAAVRALLHATAVHAMAVHATEPATVLVVVDVRVARATRCRRTSRGSRTPTCVSGR